MEGWLKKRRPRLIPSLRRKTKQFVKLTDYTNKNFASIVRKSLMRVHFAIYTLLRIGLGGSIYVYYGSLSCILILVSFLNSFFILPTDDTNTAEISRVGL